MDGSDLRFFAERLRLLAPEPRLGLEERRQLFQETRCHGAWLQLDVPRATFREWILNVHGQRVVGGTRSGPDAADSAGLAGIVESAEFTAAD